MIDNLTIAFSGYNIRDNLILAIQSFLLYYPNLKDSIVIFDDYSTDGTVEYFRELGIKIITWKFHANKVSLAISGFHHRCNLINNEIIDQCETKYLLVNDGDVAFTGTFMNKYEYLMHKYSYKTILFKKAFGRRCPKNYTQYLSSNNIIHRAHPYHMLLDVEYLRQYNIIFDRIEDIEYINHMPEYFDCGVDFLYQLESRDIPFYNLTEDRESDKYIQHFCWASSYERAVIDSNPINNPGQGVQRNLNSLYQSKLNNPTIANIVKQYNLNLIKE